MEPIYISDNWELLIPNQEIQDISFGPENIEIKEGEGIKYTPQLSQLIDRQWNKKVEEAREQGHMLYNGEMVRFSGYSFDDDRLTLELGKTSWKEFTATNISIGQGEIDYLPPEERADVIGVISFPVTEDNSLVFSKRSNKVSNYKGKYSTFGQGVRNIEETLANNKSIFNLAKNSVIREMKLDEYVVEEPSLMGLNHTLFGHGDYGDYLLLFETNIARTSEEIHEEKNKILENQTKYSDIITISLDNEEQLTNFLNQNHYDIVGTGEPGFILEGRKAFGNEWVKKLKHVKINS